MTGDQESTRHADGRSSGTQRIVVFYTHQVLCADNYIGSDCVCIPSETFECGENGEIICRSGYIPNPNPSPVEGPCQIGTWQNAVSTHLAIAVLLFCGPGR